MISTAACMTPDQFRLWRKELGLTQAQAAFVLGISRSSVELYEAGRRRDNGRDVLIPRSIALACAALINGLAPWPHERDPLWDGLEEADLTP